MNYFFLIFPLIVWVISQTIKFIIRLFNNAVPIKLKGLFWVYVWGGGTPSTHTAILTSALTLVWNKYGFSEIFTFCFAITMLWLYDMATQHKRQVLLNAYYEKGESRILKMIAEEGYLLDLAGHSVKELAAGAILGLLIGITVISINIPY